MNIQYPISAVDDEFLYVLRIEPQKSGNDYVGFNSLKVMQFDLCARQQSEVLSKNKLICEEPYQSCWVSSLHQAGKESGIVFCSIAMERKVENGMQVDYKLCKLKMSTGVYTVISTLKSVFI